MIFLLDDEDTRSINPPPAIFRRLRRDRRRIFRMYAAEFRRESVQVIERRLAAIGRNNEWDELGPALARAGKLFRIWLSFYRAWAVHGLHLQSARAIVTESLQVYERLLAPNPA